MEYKFRYYTDNDGLSSNTIHCFYQDDRGYVWVGTSDGLDRFNSCDFTNYRSDYRIPDCLGTNCIYSLCGENFMNSDRIWVGTSDGVYIYDPKDESFVPVPIERNGVVLRNLQVYTLVSDRVGNIWIGTIGDGLFRYSLRTGSVERYDSETCPETFTSDVIVKILLTAGNQLWVASGGGPMLSRYNPETNKFTTYRVEDTLTRKPIGRICALCQDSFGDIWIGGGEGELYKFELSRQTFTGNYPPSGTSYGRVRELIEYVPGELMMGTECGLVSFDAKDRSFVQLDAGTSNRNGRLNDKFIHSMLKDREGGIWIGTWFGGINYISPLGSLFETIEPGPGCGRVISKFCEDPRGNIWIGSDDGGLSLYDPREETYVPVVVDPANPSLNIHAVAVDGPWLWVGTFGNGLYRMDRESRDVKHFAWTEDGTDDLDVYSVMRDSRGTLWIGTKEGICRYEDDTQRIESLLALGHNSDVVDICEDRYGQVWFASQSRGLIRYSVDGGEFAFFSGDDRYGLADFVSCLAVEDDHLWIGTHGHGLCRYDIAEDRLARVFDDTTYGNCAVFQIIQDGGDLWLSTNRGLLKFSCRDAQKKIYKYTSEDGLLANIFNANSGIKSSTGHIYVGCNTGINRFYPYDFTRRENSARLTVVFPDFKLFNQRVPLDGKVLSSTIDCQRSVRFRSRKGSFSLDFIALNFSSPLRTVYRYRLENFDREWLVSVPEETSGVQHVSYTNLPSGTYRFVVSASNNGEQFGEEAEVLVGILPPWWLGKGMVGLYVLLGLSALGFGGYLLRRKLVRTHREQIASIARKNKLDLLEAKVAFFDEVARDIQAPVAMISAPVEAIAQQVGDPEKIREDMGIVRKNCDRLLQIVKQISNLKVSETQGPDVSQDREISEYVDVRKMLSGTFGSVCRDISHSGISVNLSLPESPVEGYLCADCFSRMVESVLREALQLAETRVELSLGACEEEGDRVFFTVTVTNDGVAIGRNGEARLPGSGPRAMSEYQGLGSGVLQDLAYRVGAEVSIRDLNGQGTAYVVRYPLERSPDACPSPSEDPNGPTAFGKNSPPRILLVESHQDSMDFLMRHLAGEYRVECVAQGRKALERLRTHRFSAVVGNVQLSGEMDGIRLCEEIRADGSLNHLPVILLNAGCSDAERIRGIRAGADVFLEKPESVTYLGEQIRSLIALRNQLRLKYSKMPYLPLEEDSMPDGSRFMERVNRYIMDNISNAGMTVDDIADAVNVSRTLLFSRIKALTGTTPNELLRSVRLKVAAELLAAPNNLRVTEICYMVGFTSTSYFAKCFKTQYGVLPTEFMERYCSE